MLRSGQRLDMIAATHHEEFADEDYKRLRNISIFTAREGLRWHLIETVPGTYDFSSVKTILRASQRHGVTVIWDLCHFGWPDDLDIFSSEWIRRLGGLAAAFARFLQIEHGSAFVAPVNEISFTAWAGGDVGYLNPFACGCGAELKRQLVLGALEATRALRSELHDIRLIAPEPVIHVVPVSDDAFDLANAECDRLAMFEAWDMLSGRQCPELGGDPTCLGILGINYYDQNQRFTNGRIVELVHPQYRPFREILTEIHHRYQRPMFVAETSAEDDHRAPWFRYVAAEVDAAIRMGTDIHGICLYPVLNHPGWDDGRHCCNGLWDYPGTCGDRELCTELAAELAARQNLKRTINEKTPWVPGGTSGCNLPLSPSMELCFSTPATSDDSLCAEPARLLY